jgi:hypothetical protein
MLELRTVTWWLATRQPARIGLDKVPSAAFVEGLLSDSGKDKRDAAKKRENVDGDQLLKSGKWLTPQVGTLSASPVFRWFRLTSRLPIAGSGRIDSGDS